jgi:Na+-transporting NADH:ubiquinone oxidoreductase subunit C
VSSNDSIGKIIRVAFALCIVCSVIVSTAAVMLKPAQEANKDLDRKRNILAGRGHAEEGKSVEELFAASRPRYVDLRSGRFADAVPAGYEQRARPRMPPCPRTSAMRTSPRSAAAPLRRGLPGGAGEGEAARLDKVILPVHGYGLWSTLYGFLALESDANTIAGLGFYEHGETPGLGGEVDNPRWKAQWPGKQAYRDGEVEIALLKGAVDPPAPTRSGASTALRGNPHQPRRDQPDAVLAGRTALARS